MVIHREGKYVVVELEKLGVDTENSDQPIFWGDLCIYFIDFWMVRTQHSLSVT